MNWFRRQLPNQQMNRIQDEESIYLGFTTAVAAAAFSIHSREEAESNGGNKMGGDASTKPEETSEITRRFSFKKTKTTGETSVRHSAADQKNQAISRGGISARKPSRSFPDEEFKNTEDAHEKSERSDKLKSILSWRNGKKTSGA